MQMPTKPQLQLSWCVFVGLIALASWLPGASLHKPLLGLYIDSGWAHFLAFAIAAFIPLLACRLRTALTLVLGIAILSVSLQVMRGLTATRAIDSYAIVINVLGIAAGILFGLNIGALRDPEKPHLN